MDIFLESSNWNVDNFTQMARLTIFAPLEKQKNWLKHKTHIISLKIPLQLNQLKIRAQQVLNKSRECKRFYFQILEWARLRKKQNHMGKIIITTCRENAALFFIQKYTAIMTILAMWQFQYRHRFERTKSNKRNLRTLFHFRQGFYTWTLNYRYNDSNYKEQRDHWSENGEKDPFQQHVLFASTDRLWMGSFTSFLVEFRHHMMCKMQTSWLTAVKLYMT